MAKLSTGRYRNRKSLQIPSCFCRAIFQSNTALTTLSAILNTSYDNLASFGHSVLILSCVHFYRPNLLSYFIFHLFTQFLSHVLSCEMELHQKKTRTKWEKVNVCPWAIIWSYVDFFSAHLFFFSPNIFRFVLLFFFSYSLSTEPMSFPIPWGSTLILCLADSPTLVNQVFPRWLLAIHPLQGKMYFNNLIINNFNFLLPLF